MNKIEAIRKKLWTPRDPDDVPPLGSRETLVNWMLDVDSDGVPIKGGSLIELIGYNKLRELLPDKIVESLEKSRLAQDGKIAMLTCGGGSYEELLSSVIVDGTAIASSSTEAFLFPALLFPQNYMQPGGIPGRTLKWEARGRHTTLTTNATLTFKLGSALTNVIPTTIWCVSGGIKMDATIQTNTQWRSSGIVTSRLVGTAGTVFAQGDCLSAAQSMVTVTAAENANNFMGQAGAAAPAIATVDLTAALFVSLTAKWSLATAYSIQGHTFTVEMLN